MEESSPDKSEKTPDSIIDKIDQSLEGHDELLNDPNYLAGLAYAQLDEVLQKWMEFHPGVSREDVDEALERFHGAVRQRDDPQHPTTE